jgi:hypothetical protein
MPAFTGTHKAGRLVLAACLGITGLALTVGSASAQQQRREVLRTPTETNFLNPGPVSSDRRGPGYVVNGLVSAPAYGPNDQFNRGLLPPVIGGGGQPLIGSDR